MAGAPSIVHPHELLNVPHHACWLRAMSRYGSELLVTRVPGEAQAGPEAQVLARRGIEQALLVLDEREQRVIQLYYEFDLTLPEIGAVLNLTTARICQLHRGALKKMRGYLERS